MKRYLASTENYNDMAQYKAIIAKAGERWNWDSYNKFQAAKVT